MTENFDTSSSEAIIASLQNPAGLVYDDRANKELIRNMNATKFVFHPWMPINNIGYEGPKFEVPYSTFDRFRPLLIVPYKTGRPQIRTTAGVQFSAPAFGSGDAQIAAGGARIVEAMQYPPDSVKMLCEAYGEYGLICLESLTSDSEPELKENLLVYAIVMAYCAPDRILLEDAPAYFGRESRFLTAPAKYLPFTAETAIETALRAPEGLPFETVSGTAHLRLLPNQETKARQLAREIADSIDAAHARALDPLTGILPQTRDLMQAFKAGDRSGKRAYDAQDSWLMHEFPSFPMNTDLENANAQLLRHLDKQPPAREIVQPGEPNTDHEMTKELLASLREERELRKKAETVAAQAVAQTNQLTARFNEFEQRLSAPPAATEPAIEKPTEKPLDTPIVKTGK